jgi:hypothetical protein
VAGEEPDDPTIADAEVLWRRIPPWKDWIVWDDNQGRLRPSSMAFQDHPDGTPMSVFLAAEAVDPVIALEGLDDFLLAAVTAGETRIRGQRLVRAPLIGTPAGHTHVIGRKTHRNMSPLAKSSTWVIEPSELPSATPHGRPI